MKDDRKLEHEPLRKLYVQMVIPAVAAQMINLIYNLVDRMYIGHIPLDGKLSLAGVGVCFPIITAIAAFAQLGGVGGAARVSFYLGKDDKVHAEKALFNSFTFLLVSGLLLTILIWGFRTRLLQMFGADPATMPYATGYLNIYVFGTVFVELTTGLIYFITAEGFSRVSLRAVLVGAGLNILLDPLFIYVFHLGVKGAATATVLSQMLSLVFVLHFLRGDRTIIQLTFSSVGHIDWGILANILALGLSPFVMQMTESLVNICFNRSLVQYGGVEALGAMAVFSSIMSIVIFPLMGIGQGVQPIVGFNYGAGNTERVRKVCLLALGNGLFYSTVMWGLIRLIPGLFVNLFSTDPAFTGYALSKAGIFFGMLWIMGIQVVIQNLFVALGNAKQSLFLALLRKVFLLVPLIYVLPAFVADQVTGVFLAEPVADTIAAITTVSLFWWKYRKILFKKPLRSVQS